MIVDDHDRNDDVVLHVDDDEKSETSFHAKMLIGINKTWAIFQLASGMTIDSFSVNTYKTERRHKAD